MRPTDGTILRSNPPAPALAALPTPPTAQHGAPLRLRARPLQGHGRIDSCSQSRAHCCAPHIRSSASAHPAPPPCAPTPPPAPACASARRPLPSPACTASALAVAGTCLPLPLEAGGRSLPRAAWRCRPYLHCATPRRPACAHFPCPLLEGRSLSQPGCHAVPPTRRLALPPLHAGRRFRPCTPTPYTARWR
ncbi:hypothetical protein B0H15DRAFT_1026659 [Mycena belliarum]|uniref:Uncharacterized protein n=1 Tax=Mycena belliarum TaxID=1033014 RepID=A0AAD6TSN8_9AGAR|nr:hypothetical protein B0H15DRAFT_1026659 [Mycena belliae]